MPQIIYRRLRNDETALIVEYRIAFLIELQGDQELEKKQKLRASLTEYFQNALHNESFVGWVAEKDSIPVGFGGMLIQQIPGLFNLTNGKIGYILNMYTIPRYRKKGICSAIINNLIEDGRQLGLSKVYLHASKDGIELYRKKGFCDPHLPELELKLDQGAD